MSTLGFERIANPYLRAGPVRDAFVAEILGHVPPVSAVLQADEAGSTRAAPIRMPTLPGATTAIGARDFHDAGRQRPRRHRPARSASFGAGHIPGAFGIGAHGQPVDLGRVGGAVRHAHPPGGAARVG